MDAQALLQAFATALFAELTRQGRPVPVAGTLLSRFSGAMLAAGAQTMGDIFGRNYGQRADAASVVTLIASFTASAVVQAAVQALGGGPVFVVQLPNGRGLGSVATAAMDQANGVPAAQQLVEFQWFI